jgi:lysozyme family protein
MSDALDTAFALIMDAEGGAALSMVRSDPGNWTGGKVGSGSLRGTRYGISAAAFPSVNIGALTEAQAKSLFETKYWSAVRGDDLPGALALLAVDAAFNGGHPIQWIQGAAGQEMDGDLGPITLAAVQRAFAGPDAGSAVLADVAASHLGYLAGLPTWTTFGARGGEPLGWSTRLTSMLVAAARLSTADA